MTNTTKITGLTGSNVAAIQQAITENVFPTGQDQIVVRKTTVTFPWTAAHTADVLDEVKAILAAKYGSRQHPVASLHAVIRKANRAALES